MLKSSSLSPLSSLSHSPHPPNPPYSPHRPPSSQLDTQYPRFPSEKQLKNNLVSVHDCAMEPKHTVLSHFLEDRHRLAVGGTLLPDLVEFYLWLDVHLAHLIKYEVAQTMTVGHLIERASQRFPSEEARLKDLFTRMKGLSLPVILLSLHVVQDPRFVGRMLWSPLTFDERFLSLHLRR